MSEKNKYLKDQFERGKQLGEDKSISAGDAVRQIMGEAVLVNRKKFVSSLANELVEPFNELSKKTRINKSRLLDEAIEDLLKKYEEKGG